jgi:hypothetical protein
MRHAQFRVIRETREQVVIEDVGPWNEHPTVTNDAEWVVEQLADKLHSRTLLYFDSFGDLDELLVKNGRFAGFRVGAHYATES